MCQGWKAFFPYQNIHHAATRKNVTLPADINSRERAQALVEQQRLMNHIAVSRGQHGI